MSRNHRNDRFGRVGNPLLAALLCSILLSGCGEREDITVIRLAHGLPTTHPVHKAMESMAAGVSDRSAGTMRIDIFPAEQLGTERDCLELMQIGSVGIGKVSAAVMESFAPAYEVLSLPYIFRDEDHCWEVLEGPVGREILNSGEAVSLRGLCFYDAGSRSFYTVDRPVHEPADLEGLKIRVQESPTAKELINSLGASATPIPWGELYSALQQGVVDGAENNPPSFYLSHHYEVARYYTLNEHTFVPDVLLVSTHTWKKLTPQQQAWLQEAANESSIYQRTLWKRSSDEALEAVKDAGVEVIEPDKSLFAGKIQSMLKQYRQDPQMAAMLDRIERTGAE